jgi:cytochrome c biogenesis protein
VTVIRDQEPAQPPVDLGDAARLSTAPAPVTGGSGGGLLRTLRTAWRRLTSMRTALLLLTLLALAAIPGTLLPQRGLNPVKVNEYIANHPQLGPFLDKLSLFDVFAAPWFAAIYLLLFISLIGCLVPRIRLHARSLRRRPPAAPRNLSRLSTSTRWQDERAPEEIVAAASSQLSGKRWRADRHVEEGGTISLAGEKGYLRETGNLVFHVSLVALLAGIAVGGLFGYKGTVLVVEGKAFSNARSSYDIYEPSRLSSDTSLKPFLFTLRDFSATYQPSGEPSTFDAVVDYQQTLDAEPTRHDIRVNHPLHADGANVYLIGHGYALDIVVKDARGVAVVDGPTPFLPDDAMFASHGVVKVPDGLPYQLGLTGFFYPTYGATPFGPQSTFPGARDPVLSLAAWKGDLGLSSGIPQSVYELPTSLTSSKNLIDTRELTPGETWKLPGGGSVTFKGVHEWATFQIAHDPGKQLVLVAAVLVVAGLLVSLRVRRRRLWVRAVPVTEADGSRRTVVEAAGLARNDAEAFTQEFDSLVQRMKD